MIYSFSAEEISFLCVIFNHPLPSVVKNPFENTNKHYVKEKWDLFCEKLLKDGVLKIDKDENLTIDDNLSDVMMTCFGAETIVTIFNNEQSNNVFYIGSDKKMLLKNSGDKYFFNLFDNDEKFNETLLDTINVKLIDSVNNTCEKLSYKIPTNEFESLLVFHDNNDTLDAAGICLKHKMEYDRCTSIIQNVRQPSCITVLTERVSKPGTIITKLTNKDGIIKLIKRIYSKEDDVILLTECLPIDIIDILINFGGM